MNCICPGTVDTPWIGRLAGDDDLRPLRLAVLRDRQVVGRLGMPAEIAAAVAFLASEDASFVTGAILAADGGMLAKGG